MFKIVLGLLFIAFAGVFIFGLCKTVQFFKKLDKEQVLHTLKRWYFLFRWFIIGRYHCDIKNKCSKKAFITIRWALLFFIIYSCTMSCAGIVEFLRPFWQRFFA